MEWVLDRSNNWSTDWIMKKRSYHKEPDDLWTCWVLESPVLLSFRHARLSRLPETESRTLQQLHLTPIYLSGLDCGQQDVKRRRKDSKRRTSNSLCNREREGGIRGTRERDEREREGDEREIVPVLTCTRTRCSRSPTSPPRSPPPSSPGIFSCLWAAEESRSSRLNINQHGRSSFQPWSHLHGSSW